MTHRDEQIEKKFQAIEADTELNQKHQDPITFKELEAIIKRWLLIEDVGLIKVLTACVLSNRLEAEPVWLLIVAGSGGTKTELLRGLNGLKDIYPLSDLTPQTFLSGVIITMKDFTTVLEMSPDKRAVILSQLREIYDGDISKGFGTGETKRWTGKMGFIAGVTTIIDRRQTIYQMLGERFIQYKPIQPNRLAVAKQAMANSGLEKQMREEIQNAFTAYIEGVEISGKVMQAPEKYKERLLSLAAFCTQARSGVVRDSYSRDIVFVPEPELPTRLVKQYVSLFNAMSLTSGDYTEADYRLMYKIGMDSLPSLRKHIIENLIASDGSATVSELAESTNYPENSIRRQLEELQCLNIVGGDSKTMAYSYELTENTRKLLANALPDTPSFSETLNQLFPDKPSLPEKSGGI
jgi:predicted transcriptional regulator